MPIAKSHSNKKKIDRKTSLRVTQRGTKLQARPKQYAKTEELIDEVYVDIANGVSKSEIRKKIELGLYEAQDGVTASRKTGYDYYNAAIARFAEDCDVKAEELRQIFYGRYESILQECIKNGDMFNARATLDSMAKIFLGVRDNQTNIQLNSSKDGGITINFGFDNKAANGEVVVDEN